MDASIAQHQAQQESSNKAVEAIEALLNERDDLLKEVNNLRALCQPGVSIPRMARPVSPAVQELLSANKAPAASPVAGSSRNLSIGTISDHASPATIGSFMPVVPDDLSGPGPIPLPPGHPFPNGETVPSSNYDMVNWNWNRLGKDSSNIPENLADGASLLWNSASEIPMTAGPKEMHPAYSPAHLVDNSAMFWTHHPGQLTTTPSHVNAQQFDPNTGLVAGTSLIWTPQLSDPTDETAEGQNLSIKSQMIHSHNSLVPSQSI